MTSEIHRSAIAGRVNVRRVDYETDYVKESETYPGDFRVHQLKLDAFSMLFTFQSQDTRATPQRPQILLWYSFSMSPFHF